MGSILPQIQCHFIFGMTLYTQCNTSAITMKTCLLFANTLTAFAFTWQPAGAIQAQFAVALTLTLTTSARVPTKPAGTLVLSYRTPPIHATVTDGGVNGWDDSWPIVHPRCSNAACLRCFNYRRSCSRS